MKGEVLGTQAVVLVCEYDGDCQDDADCRVFFRSPVFNSDLGERRLCRAHALRELRRGERMSYGPVIESLSQLELF